MSLAELVAVRGDYLSGRTLGSCSCLVPSARLLGLQGLLVEASCARKGPKVSCRTALGLCTQCSMSHMHTHLCWCACVRITPFACRVSACVRTRSCALACVCMYVHTCMRARVCTCVCNSVNDHLDPQATTFLSPPGGIYLISTASTSSLGRSAMPTRQAHSTASRSLPPCML